MTDTEKEIKSLLSNAQHLMYYAEQTDGAQKTHWIEKAQEIAYKASRVPKEFKYKPFEMPEWGTYGT